MACQRGSKMRDNPEEDELDPADDVHTCCKKKCPCVLSVQFSLFMPFQQIQKTQ